MNFVNQSQSKVLAQPKQTRITFNIQLKTALLAVIKIMTDDYIICNCVTLLSCSAVISRYQFF